MKIILANRYFHPDQSATSRMVSSLAFSLAKQGVQVTVLTSRSLQTGSGPDLPAHERTNGVEICRLTTSAFGRQRLMGRLADYVTFHLSAATWLLRNVRPNDICVVCTDPPMLSVTCALPARIRGGRIVNWIMDLFPETALELGVFPGGLASRAAIGIRNWSLDRGDLTICPIPAMANHLEDRAAPSCRFETVHHWTDDGEIHPVEPALNTLRRGWDLQDKFVVGYSGNFGRAHEFSTMMSAAETLRPDDDIRFLMIGDGQQRGGVEEEARRRGLSNILFRPYQPASCLAESLSAADVHLVSLLPILEYCIVPSKLYGILAAGRPTIFVGDTRGEVATVIAEGRCGLSVAPGDGEALARHIRRLRNDPAERRSMGRNARLLMEERFSLASGVERWKQAVGVVGSESAAQPAQSAEYAA